MRTEKFAGKSKELRVPVGKLKADKPRLGSPGIFSAEQVCQIIALACETPPEYLSHWTRKELVHETRLAGYGRGDNTFNRRSFVKIRQTSSCTVANIGKI